MLYQKKKTILSLTIKIASIGGILGALNSAYAQGYQYPQMPIGDARQASAVTQTAPARPVPMQRQFNPNAPRNMMPAPYGAPRNMPPQAYRSNPYNGPARPMMRPGPGIPPPYGAPFNRGPGGPGPYYGGPVNRGPYGGPGSYRGGPVNRGPYGAPGYGSPYGSRNNSPFGGGNGPFQNFGMGPFNGDSAPWETWPFGAPDSFWSRKEFPFDEQNPGDWFQPGDPKEGMAIMWDDLIAAPDDLGTMPGGWTVPSVRVPNPIDLEDQLERASKEIPDLINVYTD